ncbi:hypothetical protein CS022_13105 [Veronia nyctiphanis]|uniref:DUF2834 domain-containing protein n=1 Tax=Veronia nyctiphanis TaxID=1278244 RepID=A0A4V1LST3_9GAMM|nr:DUF2834 domain-containing protein [Veronia nyctiphanis]RXJ72798.1 hypothetical protein CS022_13105 [Veronia nyctiphanis]
MLKNVYLGLAIIGAVVPYLFFWDFMGEYGIDIPLFLSMLFPNDAAGGFVADLLVSSAVFWVFMFVKQQKENGPKPWIFIALNVTVGLSCALPAYLYAIEEE